MPSTEPALDSPAPAIVDHALVVVDALLPMTVDGHVPLLPSEVADRLREFTRQYEVAMSESTVRAVRGDWTTYATWCRNAGVPPLVYIAPSTAPAERIKAETKARTDLQQFFQNAIDRGLRRATLDRYLSTIRLAHRAAGVPDPTAHPMWTLIWKGIARQLAKDGRNRKRPAAPLRQAQLTAVLQALDGDLRALRDAALMCLASDTLARREEIARVRISELTRLDGGAGRLEIPSSKTDGEGHGLLRHVSAATMEYIDRWIQAAGLERGPLFRAVRLRSAKRGKEAKRKHGSLRTMRTAEISPNAIAPQEVARIFKRRLQQAGIDASRISGHSTRVGSTHDLVAQGHSGSAIARAAGWANDAMVNYYARELLTVDTAMAIAREQQPLPAPGLTKRLADDKA